MVGTIKKSIAANDIPPLSPYRLAAATPPTMLATTILLWETRSSACNFASKLVRLSWQKAEGRPWIKMTKSKKASFRP